MSIERIPAIPDYLPEQIALYHTDHLLAHRVLTGFDPAAALAAMDRAPEAIAIDLGGDKLRVARYRQVAGHLVRVDEQVWQATGGAGYLDLLCVVARDARERTLPVGISAAVRLDGSVILRTTNLPIFHREFTEKYDADFRNLFGEIVVVNDTAAGIAGSAVELTRRQVGVSSLAFFICGSGLGASVIDQGAIVHVEAAHVPLVEALNPLHQSVHCHVEGKNYVCVERVTAMRSGIELLHEQRTGHRVSAETLARQADNGDEIPTLMFETSATALAHAIAGVLERYRFQHDAVVVLHGGAFESASYRDRIQRHIACMPWADPPQLVFSRDLSANICLDGAAALAAAIG